MWPRLPPLEAVVFPEADFYIWPTWKQWQGDTTAAAQAVKAVATVRLQQQSKDVSSRKTWLGGSISSDVIVISTTTVAPYRSVYKTS